jgi:hypothetical protein
MLGKVETIFRIAQFQARQQSLSWSTCEWFIDQREESEGEKQAQSWGGPKKGKIWRPHDRTVFEEAKGLGLTSSSLCATTALATAMQKAIYCRRLTGSVVTKHTKMIECAQMVRIGKLMRRAFRFRGILASIALLAHLEIVSPHVINSISCHSFTKSAFLSHTNLSEPGQPEAYERTQIMAPSFDTLSDHDFQEDDVEDEIDFSDLREQYDVRMEEGLDTFCV